MYIRENIAATLKREMKARKMGYEAFAAFLSISRSALQDYLSAKGNPQLETLVIIAKRLDISVGELLFRGQKFHSSGRTFLNAVPEEITLLHPGVHDAAYKAFEALQAIYDLSDRVRLEESLGRIFSTEQALQ